MKFKELSSLSAEKLSEKRKEIELELIKERAQIAAGTTPKNPGMIREMKRTVARINTLEKQTK